MIDKSNTEVGNQEAIRQIRRPDGLEVLSTIKSAGGFRFVHERKECETTPIGDRWYWIIEHESGIYPSEQDAFDDAFRFIPWLAASVVDLSSKAHN
jgi:hypothetical protein